MVKYMFLENLKVADLINTIILLASFIGAIGVIQKWTVEKINKMFNPINEKLSDERMDRLKHDIVNFMCEAENGTLSEEQKILLHEEYDEYVKLGGNSYVHEKWEKLEKEGRI